MSEAEGSVAGPLRGVRVLELPALGPVPFAGMLLADLGADVVRIDRLPADRAGLGDAMAGGPLGRGRRSIALDLRAADGAEVVLRLAEHADVLVEGFRPGVAERLGVGPDVVLARNPRLVYGRMTGWGQDGPLAATAGHDINYLSISGLLHGIGPADGPPVPPINYVADFGGGAMFLVTGILAALLHARATGAGQIVDAAMVDGASYLGSMTRALMSEGQWSDAREANLLDGGAPNYRCYACADGKYVAVGALEPKFWAELVAVLGLDAAGVPSPYERAQWAACKEVLAARFATRSRDEWAELFAGTDACVTPVLTFDEAPRHPQTRNYVRVGAATMPGPAPRFSVTAAKPHHEPIALGADTEALLTEAGYSASEQARLRTAGVIE